MLIKNDAYKPDKTLVAVCGLFCPACGIFIAQSEGQEEQRKMAENLQIPVEALKCDGCRSENRFIYCETCRMVACAAEKELDYCIECKEYPCTTLTTFQSAMPHRIELWQAQIRIKEVGYKKWFKEMIEHYSCTQCGTINSAYHIACRYCGATPSCAYVNLHKEKIEAYLSNTQQSSTGKLNHF